jgi:Flp pilus assembly protein TadD
MRSLPKSKISKPSLPKSNASENETMNRKHKQLIDDPRGTHMSKTTRNKPMIGLAMTTALAGVALSGCSTLSSRAGQIFLTEAQVALANHSAKSKRAKAQTGLEIAEAAVEAEPRNAQNRALLGASYMKEGRFQSAATSFGDAIALGNTDARTILSYALAETANGNNAAALAALKEHRGSIDDADLGLAYALAGEPARGVHVLSNAVRNGQSDAKTRQNLAYAYALQGNWRAARLMAAEDVPADQLNERIAEWAANIGPQAYQTRVAKLLNVTPSRDEGQPAHLALSGAESPVRMATAPAPAANAFTENGELAPISAQAPESAPASGPIMARSAPAAVPAAAKAPAPVVAEKAKAEPKRPARFAAAFGSPAAKPSARTPNQRKRYVSNPVVQKLPANYSQAKTPTRVAQAPVARAPAAKPAMAQNTQQRRMVSTTATPRIETTGTHLVQLGSFTNRAVAEAASKKLQQRYSQLKGRDMVITEARVKGKTYWRVAAAGFGQGSAKSACSSLKRKGLGCFAYSAARKLPGAVDKGVRIAAR